MNLAEKKLFGQFMAKMRGNFLIVTYPCGTLRDISSVPIKDSDNLKYDVSWKWLMTAVD